MTDLPTLRAACESALSRAEGKTSQPVVPLLPARMVLGLVEAAEELARIRAAKPAVHHRDCAYHLDQYPWECTCHVGATPLPPSMTNLPFDAAHPIDPEARAIPKRLKSLRKRAAKENPNERS